jgi:hypothetical protein
LDEPQRRLVVANKEEDSDTKASGSWAVLIPRYDNHEVEPRSIFRQRKKLWLYYQQNGIAGSCSVETRKVHPLGTLSKCKRLKI